MQAIQKVTRFTSRIFSTNLANRVRQVESVSLPKQYHLTQVTLSRRMSTETPTYTVDYLTNKLRQELEAQHMDIMDLSNCGCGMKFDAVIVSPKFEGKSILQRQRLVNQTLVEEMKYIHAFTMRTLTPTEWAKHPDNAL